MSKGTPRSLTTSQSEWSFPVARTKKAVGRPPDPGGSLVEQVYGTLPSPRVFGERPQTPTEVTDSCPLLLQEHRKTPGAQPSRAHGAASSPRPLPAPSRAFPGPSAGEPDALSVSSSASLASIQLPGEVADTPRPWPRGCWRLARRARAR